MFCVDIYINEFSFLVANRPFINRDVRFVNKDVSGKHITSRN